MFNIHQMMCIKHYILENERMQTMAPKKKFTKEEMVEAAVRVYDGYVDAGLKEKFRSLVS